MATKKTSSKKAEIVEVNADDSLSAEDLEAQIAATASAIGSARTVNSKVIPKGEEPSKNSPPEKTTPKTSGHKAAKPIAKASTKIKKTSTIITDTPKKVDDKAVESDFSHHAKTISPLHSAEEVIPKAILKQTTPAKKLAPKHVDAIKLASKKPKPPKHRSGVTRAKIKDTSAVDQITVKHPTKKTRAKAVTSSAKSVVASKQVASETSTKPTQSVSQTKHRNQHHGHATPHVARIYDTTTYHMPLEVNHHHRRSGTPMWVQLLVLACGLLGLVAVAYMQGYL